MARRTIWQINMGDGTWSVCCMGCRTSLYRGTERRAARVANRHTCAPIGERRHRRGGGR
jgi:hypothetical protein